MPGFTLGALIVLGSEPAVGKAAMGEWGWRIPFLIGGPLGLVGLYLRSKVEDTPVFRELADPETARASIRGTGIPGVDTEVKPLHPTVT